MNETHSSSKSCDKSRILKPNMGPVDRVLRTIFALGLLYSVGFSNFLAGEPFLQLLAVAFSFLNLFAVSTRWCVMYCFTGTDTRSKIDIEERA